MIGLLGKKIGMAQIFDETGRQIPVTVVEAGPCHVTGLRTKDKNGYAAVQLGFETVREKVLNKPVLGYFKKVKAPALRFVREIRTEDLEGLSIGQQIGVNNFEVGDWVDIEGVSIGRGFQGVVKRHHFKGSASKSHGSMHGRVPGSIGASSFPSRVVKGMRAAGHMGNSQVTVQNLKIIKIDADHNLLAIRGSIPGADGGYVVVRTALKRGAKRKWKVQGANPTASQDSSKSATKLADPSSSGEEPKQDQSQGKSE